MGKPLVRASRLTERASLLHLASWHQPLASSAPSRLGKYIDTAGLQAAAPSRAADQSPARGRRQIFDESLQLEKNSDIVAEGGRPKCWSQEEKLTFDEGRDCFNNRLQRCLQAHVSGRRWMRLTLRYGTCRYTFGPAACGRRAVHGRRDYNRDIGPRETVLDSLGRRIL